MMLSSLFGKSGVLPGTASRFRQGACAGRKTKAIQTNKTALISCASGLEQSVQTASMSTAWKKEAALQLQDMGEDVYCNRVDLALSLMAKLDSISERMTSEEAEARRAFDVMTNGRWFKLASPYDFKTAEDQVPYKLLNWCILAYERQGLAEPLWCMSDGSSMRTVWEMEAIKQRITADAFQAFNVFDYYDEEKDTGHHYVRISLGLIDKLAAVATADPHQ